MSLSELQQAFTDYLVAGDQRLAGHVVDQGAIGAAGRIAIYGNAYQQRLREAIENDHPVLGVYLGDQLFDDMVPQFIAQHPSQTHSLRYFAERLPEFLRSYPPLADYPVIAEIALFERRLLDVFDAPDAQRVTPQDLQQLPAEHWPDMCLRFHPSVHLFSCEWNSVEIWQALKGEQPPPEAVAERGGWMLWRNPERLSEFQSLDNSQSLQLTAALAGDSFAQQCELLAEFLREDEVSTVALQNVVNWIASGAVTKLD